MRLAGEFGGALETPGGEINGNFCDVFEAGGKIYVLLTFFALRHDANVQATLPAGTPDALALYDAAHGAGRDLDSK